MNFCETKCLICVKFENISQKKVSLQFGKYFTGPSICGRLPKKLQTFTWQFFWSRLSKYCIVEFTDIFSACY